MRDKRSGDGSPTSTLELLWGVKEPPSRGPRPALTVERVVEAAAGIADEEGLERLSMRRVAERLGVGTASLYTYVPGKEELLALMLDAAVATDRLPHERPGGWREKLEGWARADWHEFRTHPWALQLASVRPLLGPNVMRWLDSALSVLSGTGLTEPEMASAVRSIDAYVRGHARLLATERGPALRHHRSVDPWRSAQERFLAEHVDLQEYPAFVRVAAAGGFSDLEAAFEFGLARLLDGIEALLASRSQG